MFLQNENFTIYEVEELKDSFISELSHPKVVIDMQNIIKIDMSAISLLISLKKSALKEEKEFILENCTDEILHALSISGCDSYLGV